MQLESHATPAKETPQQRYASLHRAIERGLDSDEIWKELAEVSLRLGHGDEAAACLRRIRNPEHHAALEARLVRLGVIEDPAERNGLGHPHAHPAAPAASHAGSHPAKKDEPPGLLEHIVDALQYQFHQHMPWLVLVTTLAFPVVVGLGGFLTAGGSPLVLAAIAALPGLSVLAVVGAMGRQILLASSGGSADVPNVPELGQLVRDARRFLLDAALVVGVLLLPTIVAMALGAPLTSTLPGLVIGAFFTPLAWGLRQVRGDFGALSPVTLVRGLNRAGLSYAGVVPVCWLLFAPAALTEWAVFHRPVWVQIAAIGPLCVVPLFVMSRLLGTWLDTMRGPLGSVLVGTKKPVKAVAEAPKAKDPKAEPQPTTRFPRRPEGLEQFTAPDVKSLAGSVRALGLDLPKRGQAAAPAPQRPPVRPGPRPTPSPASARPAAPAAHRTPPTAQPKPTAQPAPAPTASRRPAPSPRPAPPVAPREIEGRGPRRANPADVVPDLTQLPGAVVVTGSERARHGAAARPQP